MRELQRNSRLSPYMEYPRFLLSIKISETAKLIYVLLLDRARLSMRHEGWTDEDGYVFIYYTIASLAKDSSKSEMTVKDSLRTLEENGLIRRQRQGAGRPSRIFVRAQTETCLSDRTASAVQMDGNLSTNKNYSKKQAKTKRNYDYEEGESL